MSYTQYNPQAPYNMSMQPPPVISQGQNPHSRWGDHPLAHHPFWSTQPELLDILTAPDPWAAANAFQTPPPGHPQHFRLYHTKEQALNMLAARDQRTKELFCNDRNGKPNSSWPNIEWDVLRNTLPKIVAGEEKFAKVNWRAIDFGDKMRFWHEADRACEKREAAVGNLTIELHRLDMQLTKKNALLLEKDEEIKKLREQLTTKDLELEAVRQQQASSGPSSQVSSTLLGSPASPPSMPPLIVGDSLRLFDLWRECHRQKLVPASAFWTAEEIKLGDHESLLYMVWSETWAALDTHPVMVQEIIELFCDGQLPRASTQISL